MFHVFGSSGFWYLWCDDWLVVPYYSELDNYVSTHIGVLLRKG